MGQLSVFLVGQSRPILRQRGSSVPKILWDPSLAAAAAAANVNKIWYSSLRL